MFQFYRYEATDRNGRPCAGTLKASSEEEARTILAERKLEVSVVEVDREATSRLSKRTLSREAAPEKGNRRLNEFLSYAMPAGAALIAIVLIPFAIRFFKPAEPELPPPGIVECYLEQESTRDYEDQFALLSGPFRQFYGSAREYARARKKELLTGGARGVKASGIEEKNKGLREARVEARVLRRSGMQHIEFFLKLSKGKWRIDAVRDPAQIDLYLEKLNRAEDEERRKILVEFKTLTAYSDLEIEDLLKEYRRNLQRQASGGDYAFAIT